MTASFLLSSILMCTEHATTYLHLRGEFFFLQTKYTMMIMMRTTIPAPISPPITPPAIAPALVPPLTGGPVVGGGD